ncbi:hypothetical protein G7054_g14759 [Neopestalotiopsis clavispora]|nr:hypothetical protein G7054_g14759 [Neopestalotiopsis clavispora]
MPLELQHVDFADGPAMQRAYIDAFYGDEFNKTLFPGMSYDQLLEGAISRWPRNYGALGAHYKKVVDTNTGEIVSYSKWAFANTQAGGQLPKQTGIPEGYVASPPRTPEGLDDPFAIKFTERCHAAQSKYVGDRPMLELKMIGTVPAHERRGAASLMLEWATELADREGLVCWTTGSPKGLPLYQKFGFEAKEDIVMPVLSGGTYTYTAVVREPKKS